MPVLLEIELRYAIDKMRVGSHKAKLLESGFIQTKTLQQEDIYYTSLHKDFIETEECLRIRTVGGTSQITWKPPSSLEMKTSTGYWKREIDIEVSGQLDSTRELLKALDFVEYSVVHKRREVFVKDRFEVAVDDVEFCGMFIELELKSEDAEEGMSLLRMLAVRLELNDERISKTPYRDLVPRRTLP